MLHLPVTAFAQELSCDDMDKLITTGKIVYEQDGLPYYTNDKTLSRLVVYQVPDRSAPGLNAYYFTPILYVGTKKYYLYLNFFGAGDGNEDFPKVVSVYTADFNKNGLNELVIITESEGYLPDSGMAGHVRSALVAVDQDPLIDKNKCNIRPYHLY